jgi:diketogulonate reductase-like aldo/keto reductase
VKLKIDTRIALNDGRGIPALGLGVWKTPNGKQCEAAVIAALQTGYRHIDTAAIYGNEESVGAALRASGISREEVFVTTKLWNDDHRDPAKAFNTSLKRLKLDYVDLYLIHFPVKERNASWAVLEQLHASGKAKSIGVSNFTIRHLEELLARTKTVPAVNQVEIHPFLSQTDLREYCSSKNIVVEAYSPLTHGKRLDDRRLLEIAKTYAKSAAQILIRWGLQHGMVVLPKSIRRERIEENAGVFDFEISADDMTRLDNMDENLRTCWDPTDAP